MALPSLKGILSMVKEKDFTDEMFAPVKMVVVSVSILGVAWLESRTVTMLLNTWVSFC